MKFTNDFFQREVREGFEVSEMMKRAWAAQMEVLQVVADICDRNGIQYFADAGTLLGAVRHKGFIPWDDDIDICLRREDYNHLIKILLEQLPYGFSVAGMYAREERLQKAAEIPHLRIIADEKLWGFNEYMQYFHGFPYQRVGIDIFPLDFLPKETGMADTQKSLVQIGMKILANWDSMKKTGDLEHSLDEYGKLCNVKISRGTDAKNQLWKLIDTISSLCRKDEADYMTCYCWWLLHNEYILKKEWYRDVVMLPFENINIPAPIEFEKVLEALYGDYMIPIQGIADHDYPFYGHLEPELKKQINLVGFEGTIDEFCREVSSGRLRV